MQTHRFEDSLWHVTPNLHTLGFAQRYKDEAPSGAKGKGSNSSLTATDVLHSYYFCNEVT
jgi:hypothetical protein